MTTGELAPVAIAVERDRVPAAIRRRSRVQVIVLALIGAYLAYAWFAFDLTGLIGRSNPERAVILGTDSVAHKIHVTKDLRRGGIEIAVEGERTAEFKEPPDWVRLDEESAFIDLDDGYSVTIEGPQATFVIPNYGTVIAKVGEDRRIETILPGPKPEWASISNAKFDARPTLSRRLQVL